jgi:hypothetical protein
MNGLLVRVGIDSTDGGWNAPVLAATGDFAYVTITEEKPLRAGQALLYDEFEHAVQRFSVSLPTVLQGKPTHLDPDFDHLTYGDRGQRGKRVATLGAGDIIAFFASLRAQDDPNHKLVYALIGLYVIDEVVPAVLVPPDRWHENAHTRRAPARDDIVVRARPGSSGRLRTCIPIGEFRDRSYRVRRDLLQAWGGLDIKDGFIQRSVRLPRFLDADRFYRWFLAQRPELAAANNPGVMKGRVFIVMLRQPHGKGDGRADPFWEFGSFGCTGCHSKNLLHPKNCTIVDGDRIAFVQGGHLGSRLMLVTLPVRRILHRPGTPKPRLEIRWDPGAKPFRYDRAPSLFETPGPGKPGLFPKLADSIETTHRSTIDAKFASRFRARARSLKNDLALELVAGFELAIAMAKPSDFIRHYTEALPWIDPGAVISDRKAAYQTLRRHLRSTSSPSCCGKRPVSQSRTCH